LLIVRAGGARHNAGVQTKRTLGGPLNRRLAATGTTTPAIGRPSAATTFPATVRGLVSTALAAGLLVGCGGGGGGGSSVTDNAQVCAPTNPYVADATAPTVTGSLTSEKTWLRSYMGDAYLWFGEIPSVDAQAASFSNTADVYGSLRNYFRALLTPARTASGAYKDRFSFTYPTRAWNDLASSGSSAGYGIEWYADSWNTVPRGIRIATIEVGSPAAAAGLQRGDLLVSADGTSADSGTDAGIDVLNAARSRRVPASRTSSCSAVVAATCRRRQWSAPTSRRTRSHADSVQSWRYPLRLHRLPPTIAVPRPS
jgi:hypothetical protein